MDNGMCLATSLLDAAPALLLPHAPGTWRVVRQRRGCCCCHA
jgi:hypothetical protein